MIGKIALLAAVFSVAVAYTPIDIGDRLHYSYNVFSGLPITQTAAQQDGWTVGSSCDPNYGFAATKTSSGASEEYPMTLFFNGAGQVSGMGMHYYGKDISQLLVSRGFLKTVSSDVHTITVMFRGAVNMCSTTASTHALGDRLVIHPDTINYSLPVLEREAAATQWTKGSCFADMGYHYFYDLVAAPDMSWTSTNLLPIVVMFDQGAINAMFFASNVVQQSLFLDAHMWDRVPLPDILMCKNWCNSSCTWHDTDFWSTGHIFFRDYTTVKCPGGCTIGCCDKQ